MKASKPLSYWMKQKNDDTKSPTSSPTCIENTFVQSLHLDLRTNSEEFDQEFVYAFHVMKSL